MDDMMRNAMVRYGLLALVLILMAGCGGSSKNEDMKLGGIDTSEVLAGLLTRTGRTLDSVRDMASAQKAVTQLTAINDDFDDLLYHVPKLSEKGRSDLAQKARKAMPQMQQTVSQINASPGLRDILGPSMESMMEKLGKLM